MEFGSVRFFKRVILAALALMILVPTALCIVFDAQKRTLARQLGGVESRSALLEEESAQLRARLDTIDKPEKTPDAGGVSVPAQSSVGEPASVSSAEQTSVSAPRVELPAYSSLYPEMYVDVAERATVAQSKICYITFDDGPSACTDDLLKILGDEGVKATFFVVPRDDAASAERMKAIVDGGHTIGVHTYSHVYKDIYASLDAYLEDFYQAFRTVKAATGVEPEVWRFPGGSINGYNAGFYQQAIAELERRGFSYFDWNACGEDAVGGSPTSADIAQASLDSGLNHDRVILLLHDSGDKTATVGALRSIIAGYRDAGYTFAALGPEVVPIIYAYRN